MLPESSPRIYTDVSVDPFVRGFLHRPANPTGQGLVLTHGAGSNCQAPLLLALAANFAAAGFLVLRCDLPFRQDRSYGPPAPYDGKRDRAGLKNAVTALKSMTAGPVFLAGHSYGGRQSSMVCGTKGRGTADRCRPASAVLSSPPTSQTCTAPHPAFFQSAHPCPVRRGHSRSFFHD
jgi:pimeloyl-ACP methyl ester carboxylesterase